MKILAIESSCDETAAAVVEDGRKVIDFSKFDQSAFVNLIDLQKVNYIITDRSPSEKWIEYCSEQGIAREAFRAKCPPLVFDDYKLEGLKRAQREYIRDFVQVDRRTPGIQRPMGFEELKDNLFEVLAGGDFTMDFPRIRLPCKASSAGRLRSSVTLV